MLKPNILCISDALDLLERLESESIDLIYLDPPWFTSNSFNFDESKDEENLNEYIFQILQQSKRLLKSTGNLVFYSEPSVSINFHPLITRVFGSENYVAEFVIPQRMNYQGQFSQKHATMIFYKKSISHTFNNKTNLSQEEIERLFPYQDERGRYRRSSIVNPGENTSLQFIWRDIELPSKVYWRYSKNRLDEFFNKNLIILSGNGLPSKKTYLTDSDTKKYISTIWDDINALPKTHDNGLISQPFELLSRVVEIASNEGDIVLDPFCGSGTSLLVCQETKRKWIGGDNSTKAIDESNKLLKGNENKDYKFIRHETIRTLPIIWNKYESLNTSIEDIIFKMIQNGENNDVEFKESAVYNYRAHEVEKDNLTNNVLIAIASFLNSPTNGTLFIGVRDDKTILDLSKGDYIFANSKKKDRDSYELYLRDKIKNSLGDNSTFHCSISFHIINDCEICMIKTTPFLGLIFFKNEFYIRSGNRKIKLNNKEFYSYLLHKNLIS